VVNEEKGVEEGEEGRRKNKTGIEDDEEESPTSVMLQIKKHIPCTANFLYS
jgi:hypothetical protein